MKKRRAAISGEVVEGTSLNPYRAWLGIDGVQTLPDHYRLLGLALFESSADKIQVAFEKQFSKVRKYEVGNYEDLAQQVLDELSTAFKCLTNAASKTEYDRTLREQLALVATQDEPPALTETTTETRSSVKQPAPPPAKPHSVPAWPVAKALPEHKPPAAPLPPIQNVPVGKPAPPPVRPIPVVKQPEPIPPPSDVTASAADAPVDADVVEQATEDAAALATMLRAKSRWLPRAKLAAMLLAALGLMLGTGWAIFSLFNESDAKLPFAESELANEPIAVAGMIDKIFIVRTAGNSVTTQLVLTVEETPENAEVAASTTAIRAYELFSRDPSLPSQLDTFFAATENQGVGDKIEIRGVLLGASKRKLGLRRIAPHLPLVELHSIEEAFDNSAKIVVAHSASNSEKTDNKGPRSESPIEKLRTVGTRLAWTNREAELLAENNLEWLLQVAGRNVLVRFNAPVSAASAAEFRTGKVALTATSTGAFVNSTAPFAPFEIVALNGTLEYAAGTPETVVQGKLHQVFLPANPVNNARVLIHVALASGQNWEGFSSNVEFGRELSDFATNLETLGFGDEVIVRGLPDSSGVPATNSAPPANRPRIEVTSVQRRADNKIVRADQRRPASDFTLSPAQFSLASNLRTEGGQATFLGEVAPVTSATTQGKAAANHFLHVKVLELNRNFIVALPTGRSPSSYANSTSFETVTQVGTFAALIGGEKRDLPMLKSVNNAPTFEELTSNSGNWQGQQAKGKVTFVSREQNVSARGSQRWRFATANGALRREFICYSGAAQAAIPALAAGVELEVDLTATQLPLSATSTTINGNMLRSALVLNSLTTTEPPPTQIAFARPDAGPVIPITNFRAAATYINWPTFELSGSSPFTPFLADANAGTAAPLVNLRWNQRQDSLATDAIGRGVAIWNLKLPDKFDMLEKTSDVVDFDWSPNGNFLLLRSGRSPTRIWSREKYAVVATLPETDARFLFSETKLFVFNKDSAPRCVNVDDGEEMPFAFPTRDGVVDAAISDDGVFLATIEKPSNQPLISETGDEIPNAATAGIKPGAASVKYHVVVRRVAELAKTVAEFPLESFSPTTTVSLGLHRVLATRGLRLVVINSGRLTCWNMELGNEPAAKPITITPLGAVVTLSEDAGRVAVSGGNEVSRARKHLREFRTVPNWHSFNQIAIYNLETGERTHIINNGAFQDMALSPDGNRLAVQVGNSSITVLNVTANVAPLVSLFQSGDTIMSISWMGDANRLMSAQANGTLRIYDLANPAPIPKIVRDVNNMFVEAAEAIAQKSWKQFHSLVKQLSAIPLTPVQATQLNRLRTQARSQADALYVQTQRKLASFNSRKLQSNNPNVAAAAAAERQKLIADIKDALIADPDHRLSAQFREELFRAGIAP